MLCYNGLLHCLNLFIFSWDLVKKSLRCFLWVSGEGLRLFTASHLTPRCLTCPPCLPTILAHHVLLGHCLTLPHFAQYYYYVAHCIAHTATLPGHFARNTERCGNQFSFTLTRGKYIHTTFTYTVQHFHLTKWKYCQWRQTEHYLLRCKDHFKIWWGNAKILNNYLFAICYLVFIVQKSLLIRSCSLSVNKARLNFEFNIFCVWYESWDIF